MKEHELQSRISQEVARVIGQMQIDLIAAQVREQIMREQAEKQANDRPSD